MLIAGVLNPAAFGLKDSFLWEDRATTESRAAAGEAVRRDVTVSVSQHEVRNGTPSGK
jgi:hypothetical protein